MKIASSCSALMAAGWLVLSWVAVPVSAQERAGDERVTDERVTGERVTGERVTGERVTKEQRKVYERLDQAAAVLESILDAPDASVPQGLLDRTHCVAIVPSMKKVGFGFGGRYGKGVVACRQSERETGWGPPAMISLTGGSFGLQIGVAAVDVVMLILNEEGMKGLLQDKFELGADVSIAAGPVGRAGTAGTNARMDAKILTYSRSKGLFAGIELKGAVIKPDRDANFTLYEVEHDARELLLEGEVQVPGNAHWFISVLSRRSPVEID